MFLHRAPKSVSSAIRTTLQPARLSSSAPVVWLPLTELQVKQCAHGVSSFSVKVRAVTLVAGAALSAVTAGSFQCLFLQQLWDLRLTVSRTKRTGHSLKLLRHHWQLLIPTNSDRLK